MGKDESNKASPPVLPKQRWFRWLIIGFSVIVLGFTSCVLFLRSDTGMQKVILPWVSSRINGSVTAKTAVVHLNGILHATDLRVKTFDKNGNVTIFAKFPSAELHLLKAAPELIAPELDIEVIRWPQQLSSSTGSTQQAEQLNRHLGKSFTLVVEETNVVIPPLAFMEGRAPRFNFSKTRLSCADGIYDIKTLGDISFSECPPSWRWLDQTMFRLNASTSMTPQGLLWTGELMLSNRFSTAPLPELEAFTLKSAFKLLNDGRGTMDVSLDGKEFRLADLHATVRSKDKGRSISVNLSGPALNIPTNIADTRMKLKSWKSAFSVDWQTEGMPFLSQGQVSFPGVSFSLPNAPLTYLPPLALNGRWEAKTPDKGPPSWHASADLIKGDKPLLKLVSASSGSTPLEVTIPPCKLQDLNLYANPLGVELPSGELNGVLHISFDENHLYRGKLNLNVKDLEVGLGESHENLTASIAVEGSLRPQENMTLSRVKVDGMLKSGQGVERGKFTIKLLKGSPIFFDPRDRLDTPGKLILGMTAQLRDHSKKDASELRIKCRAGLNLTENPHLWFELLGNLRERTFLQGTISANLNTDWSLRYLEISNANVQQLSGSHSELFRNLLGIELNSLSANTVIRENTKSGLPRYGFSSSLRYSGLRGLSWLPPDLSASQDLKVTGNIDFAKRKFDIAEIKLQTQLSSDDLAKEKITFDVESKEPLQVIWSPRLVIERGNLNSSAVIPSAYLPNISPSNAVEDISLSARLTATTQQDGRHLLAIAFASSLADTPILSFNVFSNFLENGQLESLDLNQVKLSIPHRLAASIGTGFPSVDLAECNARFKENRFTLMASASGIGNIPHLPADYKTEAALATTGNVLGQHLTLENLSLDCKGSSTSMDDRFTGKLKLKEQGRIRLNGAWNPTFVSIPLELAINGTAGLVNKLPVFSSPVQERVSIATDISVTGDSNSYSTELNGQISLGIESLGVLDATIRQNRQLKFMSLDIAKCIINNGDFSPELLPIKPVIEWQRLSAQGRLASEGDGYTFDITATGTEIRSSRTYMSLPFELKLSTAGEWEPAARILQLNTVELDGLSTGGTTAETAKFQLSSHNTLRVKLDQAVPALTRDSSGMITSKGSFSPFWLSKALALPPPSGNDYFAWQSSLQIIPATGGNRTVFSVIGDNGTDHNVRIDGDLTYNAHGIPTKGGVKGVVGWNPAFELLATQLHFERWKQLDFNFSVADTSDKASNLSLTWNADGVRSFLSLPKDQDLQAEGVLKSVISMDGSSLTLTDFSTKATSRDGASKLDVVMIRPWEVTPSLKKAAFRFSSVGSENLMLQMTGRQPATLDHKLQGKGTLNIYPKKKHFNISYLGSLSRDDTPFIDIDSLLTLTPSFSFKRAEINSLRIVDSRSLAQFLPELKPFAIERSLFKGSLTKQPSSYDLSGALAVQSWRHRSWSQVSVKQSMVTFAAHSKDGKQFKLTNVDFNGELKSLKENEPLASIALELAEPGSLWLTDASRRISSKLQCSAIFKKIPGLNKEVPESVLTTTIGIELNKSGLTVSGDALLNDEAGEVLQLQAQLESDFHFKLLRLKITQAQVGYRTWLSELIDGPRNGWSDARLTLDWSRTADTGELKGPYTINIAGLKSSTLDIPVESRILMKGVASMKMGGRPTFVGSSVMWHGLDASSSPLFALNFKQTGKPFELPDDWSQFSPGPVTVTGAIYSNPLSKLKQGLQPPDSPLTVSGDISIIKRKYKGALQFLHKNKLVVDASAEYDGEGLFGGLTLKLMPIPPEFIRTAPNPNVYPEFKNAEFKLSLRGEADGSWMVYATGNADQFRDRANRTRVGDLKLASHCEFIKDASGDWIATGFPFQVRWNDDVLFKCVSNLSTDLSSTMSVRFNTGTTSLPILFNVTHPKTLSPGLTCAGGSLLSSGNFTIKEGNWVANSRLLIKDASFEPLANVKRRGTAFDWDIMLNSKGEPGKPSTLKITSKGPGWSNTATLEASWKDDSPFLTALKVESEGADFSPLWEIFRSNTTFPPTKSSPPVSLYALLPSDDELRALSGAYRLNLKSVEIGPLKIDNAQVYVNAANGRLAIVDCKLDLNDGPIWATGHLESTELGSNLACRINGNSLPLRPIFESIYDGEPADDISGKLNLEVAITGRGDSLVDVVKSATGAGKLSVVGFRFYKNDALVDAARSASIDDLEYLEFETISSELKFDEGRMVTSGFKMERDELIQSMTITINANGNITIEDIKHQVSLSHYDKYFSGKVASFFGFGPIAESTPGYKVFAAPVNLVKDASGWGVKVVDKKLFKPFKDSAMGKWLLPTGSADGNR